MGLREEGEPPPVYGPSSTQFTVEDLSYGLRIIASQDDALVMKAVADKVKNFVLYFDHNNFISSRWDDVVANPMAELPKVLSPRKVHFVEKKQDEKLPEFYRDLRTSRSKEATADAQGSGSDSASDDSGDDSDFVDNDNELEYGDDDLFEDNVDEEVTDEGVAKGKKISKGKKKATSTTSSTNDVKHEVDTDEDLDLPDSDGDGGVKLKFRTFMLEDMQNPNFKLGMLFSSVEMIRKVVAE